MLTQDYLKEVLDYDQETGIFTWKRAVSKRVKPGEMAGYLCLGYCHIQLLSRPHKAHRLAWFYVYGVMPKNEIDHINGNKFDNRIKNLREATKSENLQNQKRARCDNKTGYLGVSFNREAKRFVAQIQIDYKKKFLGYFKTAEEAHQAYIDAKRIKHSFCTI